nr:hypothetical protein [uncultured Bacteroides sp.]
MATLKFGKFEAAQQSGQAGVQIIGVKYVEQHTGRGKYMKQLRASAGTANAVATYEIEGKPSFLALDTDMSEIAYNIVQATINGISNAEKFRVSTAEDKIITLKPNTGYTVNSNEGTFSEGFGLQNQAAVAILVEFAVNSTAATVEYPVTIEIWNGTEWKIAGTFTVRQSSSDADVNFVVTPGTLEAFDKAGGVKAISIESNIGFNVTKQGGSDTSWISLDKLAGNAGTTEIKITATSQKVGGSGRNLSLVFKNQVSNSVIGTLLISQSEGDGYAVSWENDTVAFANNELNEIKNNNLTANAEWYIEEVV